MHRLVLIGCVAFSIQWFLIDSFTLDDLISDESWVPTKNESMLRSDTILMRELIEFEDTMHIRRLEIYEGPDDEDDIDCFGLGKTLRKLFKFIFKPEEKSKINTMFFVSTRKRKSPVHVDDVSKIGDFVDAKNPTVLIIHGFMSSGQMYWVKEMKDALLEKEDVNVIAVDWAGGSMSWKYWRAVGNTRVVARQAAILLKNVLSLGSHRSQVYCIGHSLGAHICSFISKRLGRIGRITGLDPAEPCFKDAGLNSSQANFVDIVHTNGKLLGKLGFGIPEPIGMVDFYPNGGSLQPGCAFRDSSFLSTWLPLTKQKLEGAICSHGRSYQYFIDALRSTDCQFWGRSWDLSEKGAVTTLKKQCSMATCVPMGFYADIFPGRGAYFLPTWDKTPYCISDNVTDRAMTRWMSKAMSYSKIVKKHKLNRN